MKKKGSKKKWHFRIKRYIAAFLVLTLTCQMPSGSLIVSGFQALFNLVGFADASVDAPTIVRLTNAQNYPALQQASGDVCVDDFVEFYSSDGYVGYNAYCLTDYRNGLGMYEIERRESEFKAFIAAMNNDFKNYEGDAGGGIEYEPYETVSAGKNVNYYTLSNGSSSSYGTLDESAVPAKLTVKQPNSNFDSTIYYNKRIDVTDRVNAGGMLKFSFSMRVLSTDRSYIDISFANEGKIISQGQTWSAGNYRTSGSVDSKDMTKASDGKYYIDVKLKKSIGSIDVSDIKFNVEGTRETKFVNMYMTNNPVPAGIVGSVTNATGEDPTKTTDFTVDDDMYVVLQFTDAVNMRKKMYYDTNTKPGVAYNYAYKTYPRLALTVTDETGMEQNKNEALYADYFGVMDGFDANGNIVPNNSLIFKVDISGWENKDFSIVCLSQQLSKTKRSGNMEWAYKSLGDVANQVATLKEHWGRGWKERADNDRFRGAVLDANRKEIPITERALVRSVKVTNEKGETEEVIPTYHGSTPAIKEVVITAANGKEIVKKGDRVNIKVVFDAMLNEELPPPTFYLNDYSCYTKAKPGDEDWDGTVVSGGVYGDTRMVPLLAKWTVKKNDPNNVWIRKENQDITDNHSGAATFEITGTDEIKGNRVYYRVADDISVAMQKGDVFDPSGWRVYTKPVYLTNLPTVLKRESPINGTDKVELQRICNGGVIEVCEVTPTKVTDEDGNVTGEELIVHKFGTSDEIDTSADSEEAMVQENTAPGTVISYSVVLNGAMDVKKLFLIPDWESYEYEYYDYAYYDCDTTWRECWTYQYISRLRMDGEVENKWGKKLPEKNFGSYDSNGKFSYTSRQYSYVGTESKAPLVSIVSPSRAGYKGGSDLEKATGFRFYDYLDLPRWDLQYYMRTIPAEKGYYSMPQTGIEKYIVEVGPVKADIMVDVNGKEEEVTAGETYKRTMYVATAEKDDKSIYVATELLPDENGNYNRVDVPVTVKAIDMAGNMAVRDVTHTIGLPYAEFEPYAYYKDPVAMKYSSQKYKEEEGLFVFYPDIEDETDDFKAEWYKIAIVPQGEEPDENTQWISLGDADVVDGEKNFEIEDEQGNKLKARLWKADTCPILWVDIPVRGSTINKSIYITYETKYGNKYNYTSIDEESQKVRKTYKMADFVYDTSDVPELIDLDETTTYRVTTVDKSSDPMSGVSIELADGQMINGKLKRKNFYKFNVTTDQYTKVYYSFRTRWGGVEPVRGEIPPNSTITLDTRDLGVKYTSDSPFKGSAWLEDWTVDFIPVTIDTYTVTEYTEEYSEAGELVNTTSTVVDTYEKEGEIVNGRAKYYELPMLDEMFVRRSEEYHDFYNDDTSSMNYRLFLETELDYNSLNGYNDFHWYMSRKMAYTNTLFDNTTMVFGKDVSEYLEPETDIDFANSYIYIYPVKENEESGVVDYVKSGECVRKIPLPSNIREVTYSAGYGTEYTALGFDVDLNAYVTEQTVEYEDSLENGTTVEKIGMPKEGTYGAFVEIATFLEDENGEP
ncbi:MAG: hypothetical protein E7265_08700, partial [Lachnospiraceae bacterium]|nr:hypothetical protein [Lachnospiraceae bacterium]